jgi:CubicO group peptidase (beta-lactamase class C family)
MNRRIPHGLLLLLVCFAEALVTTGCARSAPLAGADEAARARGMPGAPQPASLDSLLEEVAREHGVPALAAAVVRGESIIAAGAIGVRRLGSAEAVRITDAFHLGSVAKPLTATLMAALVEAGMLSWTTTPAEVFPEYSHTLHPSLRAVTLGQLLAHTAGLANFNPGTPEWAALPALEGSPAEQRRDFARWVLARPPDRTPGSGFLYSNAGAPVAAAMAERVTGRAWEVLMQEHLFEPLDLRSAGFGWPAAADPDQPWGHQEEDGELEPQDPRAGHPLPAWMAPAADVHMSVLDLARFAAAHLQGLRNRPGLLPPEAFRQLHTPVVSRSERIDHALGWHVWAAGAGHRAARSFHAGGAGTFVAFVEISPEQDLGFVVMTNDGREPPRAVTATLRQLEERFLVP